jgi:DNA-binding NarL/FixJ family response regulator
MPIRVAIVEDNMGIQQTLKSLIQMTPSLILDGAYSSAEKALGPILLSHPDVVLMDINLPGKSGIQLVSELKAKRPKLQVMMITVYEDGDQIFASLQAGASGYLLKRSQPSEIIQGIEDLHKGGSPMSPDVARKVVLYFQQRKSAALDLAQLTPRETEVLSELAKGYRYREIADRLKIGNETVRSHIHNIYEKLHVSSRTEAVVKFMRTAPENAPPLSS